MEAVTNKRLVFITACAGMLLFGVCLITLGAMAPVLKNRFVLDAMRTGTLFSILPFGILTGSMVFGPVCDRHGYKFMLVVACIAMFIGFQGLAYSLSFTCLKICVYLFGFGGGIINGATNAVVVDISDRNKGANLSLLGVFFGLGALGMPLVLGVLEKKMDAFTIIAGSGWLTLLMAGIYAVIKFPEAKQVKGENPGISVSRLKQPFLVLIAAFLFLQSSLEAIINNWSTSYLIAINGMAESKALYALSLHMVGMVVMRLVTGSLLRKLPQVKILWIGMLLLPLGILLMQAGSSPFMIISGLFLSGAGLAGGFPVMLGFVGERFPDISATAFSFVFTVALIGNMLVNYIMGVIVHYYGIEQLATVSYAEIVLMILFFFFITRKLTLNNK